MIKIGKKVFPLNRSLTGKDNLKTLKEFKKFFFKLKIKSFRSGAEVYDWKIPDEWNVKEAYVEDRFQKKIIDIKNNSLHLVSYSKNKKKVLTKLRLMKNIYTNKKLKNAIPYVTSYYKKNWGFCITENQKKIINNNYKDKDLFKIVINSSFKKNGKMHYGEIFIPGKTQDEILISTYICHPSMANNELSGPLVSLALAKYFKKKKNKCSLRFIFVPETIGAIAYINKNFKKLKKNVKGGYILTCIGDEKNYSLLFSKYKNSLSDLAAIEAFKKLKIKFKKYNFLTRGSDERQYNSPFIDLGMSSIMRTKYGKYKEYHTSLDKFENVVTAKGLSGGYKVAKKSILTLMNKKFKKKIINTNAKNPLSRIVCEPFLTKHNLAQSISDLSAGNKKSLKFRSDILNFIQFSDGANSIKDISKHIKLDKHKLNKIFRICKINKLIY